MGPKILMENLSFSVFGGQVLGVTGQNGVGKSTLLGAIRGDVEPDSGRVQVQPDADCAWVKQLLDTPDRTALEFVEEGDRVLVDLRRSLSAAESAGDGMALARLGERIETIDGYTAGARAARILAGLGFSNNQLGNKVNTFSGGWQVRLNLARALFAPSTVLLLDEPTNHLDLDAIGWLEKFISRYKGVVMAVSHDREFLDTVCTNVLHIENLGGVLFKGNYTESERQRAERLAQQTSLARRQQREVVKLNAFIDRFRAKASKARQAQSRIKALERLTIAAPAHVSSGFRFGFETPEHLPNPLMEFHELSAGYLNQTLLSGVSGRFRPAERIAVLGRNGAGKSTLLRVLAGISRPLSGKLTRASTLRIGYFAQSTYEHLDPALSPRQLLRRVRPDMTDRNMNSFLGRFGYGGEDADQPLAIRSGGESARMALALLIAEKPNLLLLDEPTNHLDIEMRHALTVAMQSFEGCIVLVSHDRALLRQVCDEIWLVEGGAVSEFSGNLDDYLKWLTRPGNGGQTQRGDPDARRNARREAAALRAELKPYRDRIVTLEKEIAGLTRSLEQASEALANPALYDGTDSETVVELNRQCAAWRKALETAEQHWIEAVERLEQFESERKTLSR